MGCGWSGKQDVQQTVARRYIFGEKLGEGVYGQVRAVEPRRSSDSSSSQPLAVKIIRRTGQDVVNREVNVWKKLGKHTNTVELVEAHVSENMCFLIMQRCKCSVLEGLESMEAISEAKLRRIFQEMLQGIEHVHQHNIVHRDIKPDNFLWGADENETILLGDFGLAKQMPTSKKSNDTMKGVAGTAPYMSPEMLDSQGYDLRTDIWSFGVTAYLMLFGFFPYGPTATTDKEMKAAILGRDLPVFDASQVHAQAQCQSAGDEEPSDSIKDFCRAMLERDVSMRDSASQALHRIRRVLKSSESVGSLDGMTIKWARSRTDNFRQEHDPTVQKDIDGLLAELKSAGGFPRRSFTMGFKPGDAAQSSEGLWDSDDDEDEDTDSQPAVTRTASATSVRSRSTSGSPTNSALSRSRTTPLQKPADKLDNYGSGNSVNAGVRRRMSDNLRAPLPTSKDKAIRSDSKNQPLWDLTVDDGVFPACPPATGEVFQSLLKNPVDWVDTSPETKSIECLATKDAEGIQSVIYATAEWSSTQSDTGLCNNVMSCQAIRKL